MFNSNFFQKASVNFKQLIGKNIASFFYQNLPSNSLKQIYDSACSHTPQQIVTCNTNTCPLHQQMFLEKDRLSLLLPLGLFKKSPANSKIIFLDCQIPILLFYEVARKQKNLKQIVFLFL